MVCGNGGSGLPAMLPWAVGAPTNDVPNAAPADPAAALCKNCLRETGSCGISVLLVGDNQKCIIEEVSWTITARCAASASQGQTLWGQAPAVGNFASYACDLVYCCVPEAGTPRRRANKSKSSRNSLMARNSVRL